MYCPKYFHKYPPRAFITNIFWRKQDLEQVSRREKSAGTASLFSLFEKNPPFHFLLQNLQAFFIMTAFMMAAAIFSAFLQRIPI
jgi:hypothetical protein